LRYRLRQDLLAIGQDFTIDDDQGDVAFRVDGKVMAIGDKLVIKDPDGKEVGRITQKLLRLTPSYEVQRGGEVIAVVKKKMLTLVRDRFVVDVPGPDDFVAKGSFLEHEYTLKRGRTEVASVSKRWFSIRDTYGVDVADGEDALLVLATAVIIDLVCHQAKED
jgi:uncharacterized protein YxjI